MVTTAQAESLSVADPTDQILHIGFKVVPILIGVDRFFNLVVGWGRHATHIESR